MTENELKVMVIQVTTDALKGLGSHIVFHLPRIGDWLELEDEYHKAICYNVVQVIIGKYGADIYVTNPRPTTDALNDLKGIIRSK